MKLGIYVKNPKVRQSARYTRFIERLREASMELYTVESRGDILPETDMVLSIGGDGTFLSAAKRVADSGVPILGVNFGRVGFLSENDPESVLDALSEGSYSIEDRTMLRAIVSDSDVVRDPVFWPYALNEVTVHRKGASVLGVDVTIDGTPLPTYWADGLLVSTSSGSTAYSLSAGGPICHPESKVFIIEPIAPHNLNLRPLIVPDTTRIGLSIVSRDGEAVLSMDNRTMEIDSACRVDISMAQFSLNRIRLSKSNFVKALTSKLFWGEDIRNNEEI